MLASGSSLAPVAPGVTKTVTLKPETFAGNPVRFGVVAVDNKGLRGPESNPSAVLFVDDDDLPPNQIEDIAVEMRGSDIVAIEFTATGEDGDSGTGESSLMRQNSNCTPRGKFILHSFS